MAKQSGIESEYLLEKVASVSENRNFVWFGEINAIYIQRKIGAGKFTWETNFSNSEPIVKSFTRQTGVYMFNHYFSWKKNINLI